jgi:two-component SAPR family response regulator
MARIFLVEDDLCTHLALKAVLKSKSHEVVGSADKAIEATASILSLKPDMCLIDVHLTGSSSGFDVAEFILAKVEIPIIIMSGNNYPTLPLPFILKPFTVENLMLALDRALRTCPPIKPVVLAEF